MSDHLIPSTAIQGQSRSRNDQFAKGLGWFSIGLGLVELLATDTLCRALGLEKHETLVRAYGAREIATGVAILSSHDAEPWIWGRVAGDAMDLATLAAASRQAEGRQRETLAMAVAAVVGVTALDMLCVSGMRNERGGRKTAVADYSVRSGFARPALLMRGMASDFETPQDMRVPELLRPYNPKLEEDNGSVVPRSPSKVQLTVKECDGGRMVLVDEATGHEFGFKIETSGGRRVLGAFAPRWANGQEPVSAANYVKDARSLAQEEAANQGWLDTW